MTDHEQSADKASAEFRFTVFTPTYNRADTLHRPYESLLNQTFDDFEWVIVDDYSTDGTPEFVEDLISRDEASFPIRFFEGAEWYDEPGKPRAHNLGVEQARGELFVPLDSDDECIPEALERFDHHWRSIPDSIRSEFSGVTCLCQDQHGEVVGDVFPAPIMDVKSHEMEHVFKRPGERWGFQRTELLRDNPFPTPEGERYVPEQVVWSRLSDEYKLRFVNEPLRIYWREEEETEAISDEVNPAKHAAGHVLLHQTILNFELQNRYVINRPFHFVKSGANLTRFSLHANESLRDQYTSLNRTNARLFWLLCLPIGIAAYLRDRVRSLRP